ncbi:hypothetical protein J2X05_004158 [Cellvibrio fibrivorans]|uniref:Transposase n=1 Tax=Cellvibrio fibrivorans TaxID=126350 RepID=A0ABU1V3T9_9GAMM|nr:hypothetical protein [Cellvibrio fibrivorans]
MILEDCSGANKKPRQAGDKQQQRAMTEQFIANING